VTTPSPKKRCPSMPKTWLRWRQNGSSSTNCLCREGGPAARGSQLAEASGDLCLLDASGWTVLHLAPALRLSLIWQWRSRGSGFSLLTAIAMALYRRVCCPAHNKNKPPQRRLRETRRRRIENAVEPKLPEDANERILQSNVMCRAEKDVMETDEEGPQLAGRISPEQQQRRCERPPLRQARYSLARSSAGRAEWQIPHYDPARAATLPDRSVQRLTSTMWLSCPG